MAIVVVSSTLLLVCESFSTHFILFGKITSSKQRIKKITSNFTCVQPLYLSLSKPALKREGFSLYMFKFLRWSFSALRNITISPGLMIRQILLFPFYSAENKSMSSKCLSMVTNIEGNIWSTLAVMAAALKYPVL